MKRRVTSAVQSRLAALRSRTLAARLAKLSAGVDGPVVLLLAGDVQHDLSTWVAAFGAARLTVLAEHSPVLHEGVRCVAVAGRREIDQELTLLDPARSWWTRLLPTPTSSSHAGPVSGCTWPWAAGTWCGQR